MYPTFLERQWHFDSDRRAAITSFSMVGAIVGGVSIGYLSDIWGRRRTIIIALLLAILVIPLWAYAPSPTLLIIGAFLMQFMVMGAWGVYPAHLAELSPDSARALLPGFAYQFGALFIKFSGVYRSSFRSTEQVRDRHGTHCDLLVYFGIDPSFGWP